MNATLDNAPFNRTRMELKHGPLRKCFFAPLAFNRTRMELKHNTGDTGGKLSRPLLTVPEWN